MSVYFNTPFSYTTDDAGAKSVYIKCEELNDVSDHNVDKAATVSDTELKSYAQDAVPSCCGGRLEYLHCSPESHGSQLKREPNG
jgi:hypothetical protein